jgi:F-type H+-transporting ATPase subunit b
MKIDLFTLLAQVVNFIILVLLLKYLLYGRIVKAMDQRKQDIRSRLEEAGEKKKEAQEIKDDYEKRRRELEAAGDEEIRKAREEGAKQRKKLMEEARAEAADTRRKFKEAIRREREAFLADLKRRVGAGVCDVAEKALSDLAGRRLEEQMIDRLVEKLSEESEAPEGPVSLASKPGPGRPRVTTAFDLEEERRRVLKESLGRRLDLRSEIEFETDPDLVCGMEIEAGGRRISWSVGQYLDDLREEISGMLEGSEEGGKQKDSEADER